MHKNAAEECQVWASTQTRVSKLTPSKVVVLSKELQLHISKKEDPQEVAIFAATCKPENKQTSKQIDSWIHSGLI